MTVEKEKVARGKGGRSAGKGVRSVVWCVGVLRDGTVVSGDSLGMVKFWDSNTATQISSFHAHGADVLTLAVSPVRRLSLSCLILRPSVCSRGRLI
jgi:WD40 repeat protein